MNLPFAGKMETIITNFKPFFEVDKNRSVSYYHYIDLKIAQIQDQKNALLNIVLNSAFEDGENPKAFDLYTESKMEFEDLTDTLNTRGVVRNYVFQAIDEHFKIVKGNLEYPKHALMIEWTYNDEKLDNKIENALSLYFANHS